MDKEDAEDEALLAEAMSSMVAKASSGEGGGSGGSAAGGALEMIEPPVDEEMLKQLLVRKKRRETVCVSLYIYPLFSYLMICILSLCNIGVRIPCDSCQEGFISLRE